MLSLSAGAYAQEGGNRDRSKVIPVDDSFNPREWFQQSDLKSKAGPPGLLVGPVDAAGLSSYREELAKEGCKFGDAVPSDFRRRSTPSRSDEDWRPSVFASE